MALYLQNTDKIKRKNIQFSSNPSFFFPSSLNLKVYVYIENLNLQSLGVYREPKPTVSRCIQRTISSISQVYKENLNLQYLCVYKEPEPSVQRSILRTLDMVLQNRLDFKDSQRLSQRPGAYFLFRVFAFKHPVSMYCSELYILCTICTVYCQYVL